MDPYLAVDIHRQAISSAAAAIAEAEEVAPAVRDGQRAGEGGGHRRLATSPPAAITMISILAQPKHGRKQAPKWNPAIASLIYVYPRLYDVETLAGLTRSLVPLAAANATLQANARMLAASSAALQANNTVRAVAQCPPWNVTAAECALFLYNSVQDFVTPARRSSSLIMSQKGFKMSACPFDEILKTEHHIHT
ncbi:putative PX protein [Hordeum vulgare]|nr:putative PX protein [Hordeum vulgare]